MVWSYTGPGRQNPWGQIANLFTFQREANLSSLNMSASDELNEKNRAEGRWRVQQGLKTSRLVRKVFYTGLTWYIRNGGITET